MRSHSFLLAIYSVFCKLLVAVEQPTITLKEGLPAKIPCMVKGVADAYFWRRGENLTKSDEIATIAFGVPGVVSDAFRVTKDGTLMIYNVTSAIEGRYFCRISTKDNEYFSDVMVLVQALCDDFGFGIEQCYPNGSCTLQVEASKVTKLTCMAKGGPSSLSLKWFNGSKEMNSVSNEHPLNEESSTVSETITVPNEFGLPLTCEAVAGDDGKACARLAHVRLVKTDTAKDKTDTDKSSGTWIVLLVVSGFAVFLLNFYARRKKYAQKKKSFKTTTDRQEEQLSEKDTLLEQQGGELTELHDELQQKGGEIKKLQDELQQQGGELKKLQAELQEANIALEKAQKDLTAKNTTLTDANIALEAVKKGLTAENMTLKNTNIALDKVKKDLTTKNTTLTTANGKLKKARDDLTAKNTTLTTANGKLIKARDDLTAKNTALTEANGKLIKARDDLTAKNTTLTGCAE